MSKSKDKAAEPTPGVNEPYDHDPRIEELNEKLEKIDATRLAAVRKAKEQAASIMEERNRLMMEEQITLRILGNQALSVNEVDYVTSNPEWWAEIKEKTKGKRGSRVAQRVLAGGL